MFQPGFSSKMVWETQGWYTPRIVDRKINAQGVMADPPDALYKVQFVAVRMAFPIEPGFVVETNRIDH